MNMFAIWSLLPEKKGKLYNDTANHSTNTINWKAQNDFFLLNLEIRKEQFLPAGKSTYRNPDMTYHSVKFVI